MKSVLRILLPAICAMSLSGLADAQPVDGVLSFAGAPAQRTLSVFLQWGVIRVVGTDETDGTYRIRRDLRGVDPADRNRYAPVPPFTLEQGAAGTRIGIAEGQVEGFFAFVLELQVPRNLRLLDLKMFRGGEIFVDGFDGDLTVTSLNGSIRLDGIGGPVLAEARNGEINATVLRTRPDGPITLLSRNGGLTLNLGPATGGRLDIETRRGPIESEVPLKIETLPGEIRSEDYRPRRATGHLPTPGPLMRLMTLNGPVIVKRTAGS